MSPLVSRGKSMAEDFSMQYIHKKARVIFVTNVGGISSLDRYDRVDKLQMFG